MDLGAERAKVFVDCLSCNPERETQLSADFGDSGGTVSVDRAVQSEKTVDKIGIKVQRFAGEILANQLGTGGINAEKVIVEGDLEAIGNIIAPVGVGNAKEVTESILSDMREGTRPYRRWRLATGSRWPCRTGIVPRRR